MAEEFRARHQAQARCCCCPNAWDGMSARLFVAAGFEAVATTSGGVAWALGYPDGEAAPWPEVVAATARIVRAARVPVTADIEAGYGATPREVARACRRDHRRRRRRHQSRGRAAHAAPHSHASRMRPRASRRARGGARRRRADRHQCAQRSLLPAARRCGGALCRDGRARQGLSRGGRRLHLSVRGARSRRSSPRWRRRSARPSTSPDAPACPTPPRSSARRRRITIAGAPTLVAMSAIRTLANELYATRRFDSLAAPLKHPDAQALFAAIEK